MCKEQAFAALAPLPQWSLVLTAYCKCRQGGRAIAQEVSRRLPTAEARIRARV
jgi:hypothetical protein